MVKPINKIILYVVLALVTFNQIRQFLDYVSKPDILLIVAFAAVILVALSDTRILGKF